MVIWPPKECPAKMKLFRLSFWVKLLTKLVYSGTSGLPGSGPVEPKPGRSSRIILIFGERRLDRGTQ